MTAPPTMVVDAAGLEALVAEVAAEDSYGFDTEFHTERTYVPDLALIQIAWADKMALVDPLAVDPAPLATVFGGPGIAVAHAASQDLDVLMAACGAVPATVFDTQIVAGFLGLSTPSLVPPGGPDARRLAAQGGPALGLAGAADLGAPDLLRPQRRRPPAGAAGRAHRAAAGARAPGMGPERVRPGARRPHAGPRPRGGVVEARRHPGHVAPLTRRRAGGGGVARAHGGRDATGPGAWCSRTSGCSPCRSGRRGTATSCAPPAASTAATWPRAGPPRSCAAVERGLELPPDQIRMPSEGRDAPAPAGCGGRLLGHGAPDRRRPRLRPGPPGHPGRHRAAALRRAEPARYGVAPDHCRATRCAA